MMISPVLTHLQITTGTSIQQETLVVVQLVFHRSGLGLH